MLLELHVANLGVIGDSVLSFRAGLTAVTGETGAGKTLLVDALDLVLGGKPKRGLIPEGQTAVIEARFIDSTGSEVTIARELPSDGRARAWINSQPTSLAALGEISRQLCDIYGQHEHQTLLTPGAFRNALDTFGGIDTTAMQLARRELRSIDAEQIDLGGDVDAVDREIALLSHQLSEIEGAELEDPDEVDLLLGEAKMLGSSVELTGTLGATLDRLDSEGSSRDQIARLRHSLEEIGVLPQLVTSLGEAEAILDETTHAIRAALDGVDTDPARLTIVETRLQLLHDLTRRYGPTLNDVIARREEFSVEIQRLKDGQARRSSLAARRAAAVDTLEAHEREVERLRTQTAPTMAGRLRERLATLALERAVVEIEVDGPGGDRVQLLFSANTGIAPAPVAKVASGGELARLMLAIRLTLPGGPPVIVFDEVDAGIGGATAVTLAEALADIARDRQVLVVTHLAQVAARAQHQVCVVKEGSQRSVASAFTLSTDARVDEIARMLSGDSSDATARLHASELLERSRSAPDPRRVV